MTDTTTIADPALEVGTTGLHAPEIAAQRPSALNTLSKVALSRAPTRPLGKLGTQSRPAALTVEKWEGSHPRALWRCVQEDVRAGFALEQKVWGVLALCGSVSILYATYCF